MGQAKLPKPASIREVASLARTALVGQPSMTPIVRTLSRSAVAIRLYPAAETKPVFKPSAPARGWTALFSGVFVAGNAANLSFLFARL